MPVAFTDEEYRLFSEWLARQYGLHFGPEKRDILRARLDTRRAELGLATFDRLYFHLKFHPQREVARERLVSALTNNESYFFRETRQIDTLVDEVLPPLRRGRSAGDPVRVLSAGCAGGEEPYTIAMRIRETGVIPPSAVRITGVDLDASALARAREGLFRAHALRAIEDGDRDRWFEEEDGHWRLDARIREMVEFRQANLVDADWSEALEPQDAVFFRNVLIYFDDDAARRAVEGICRLLRPGGALFLGHAETLGRIPSRLVAQRRPGVLYYRKPED